MNGLLDGNSPTYFFRSGQVESLPTGDTIKPSTMIGLSGKLRKGLEGPQERVLQDVGGIFAVPGHAADEAENLFLVSLEKIFESDFHATWPPYLL
jgi:hypothetical protein